MRNFLESVGGAEAWTGSGERRPALISIGPVTSDELRAHGLAPDVEASDHDIEGVVAAIVGAV